MTLGDISYRYTHHLDHVQTTEQLGLPTFLGVEVDLGYIRWFYPILHPRMILPDKDVQVSWPLEQKALYEIVVEKDGEQGYLDLSGRLGHIRDHVCVVMSSGLIV